MLRNICSTTYCETASLNLSKFAAKQEPNICHLNVLQEQSDKLGCNYPAGRSSCRPNYQGGAALLHHQHSGPELNFRVRNTFSLSLSSPSLSHLKLCSDVIERRDTSVSKETITKFVSNIFAVSIPCWKRCRTDIACYLRPGCEAVQQVNRIQ